MGRPRKQADQVKVQLNSMVLPSVKQEVEAIAEDGSVTLKGGDVYAALSAVFAIG